MAVDIDRIRKIEPWTNRQLVPGTRSYRGFCGWGGNCDERAIWLIWYEDRSGSWSGTAACEAHGRPVIDQMPSGVVEGDSPGSA